jgi:hypothetical protein
LSKKQEDFWWREITLLQPVVGLACWHYRLTPYPLDSDTAAALEGIISNFVLPWGLVERYVEEWAYASFVERVVSSEVAWNKVTRAEAETTIPGLATLRGVLKGSYPESLVGDHAEDFAGECDLVRSMIRDALPLETPSLAGCFLRLPCLPLGNSWLSLVPLIDQIWIDRRVVELCEAAADLAKKGYSHLPAADPHSLAWHRFFPPGTRWTSPRPAAFGVFVAALRQAVARVGQMPARVRQLSDRCFLHIDDYVSWKGRQTADALLTSENRESGIPVSRWNEWISNYSDDGSVDLFGTIVSTICTI